jgi:hypothetical protein
MSVSAISNKYYQLLVKLYKNINNDNLKWTKAINADYFTAELNYQFKMRIYKTMSNLSPRYLFKMYDDGGLKVFEITSEKNGGDEIEINGVKMKVHDILEEIYDWARAFSLDIIEKVDRANQVLDALSKIEETRTLPSQPKS